VEAGQKLIVLEAMKTEIAIAAPHAGIIEKLTCAAGAMVWAGQLPVLPIDIAVAMTAMLTHCAAASPKLMLSSRVCPVSRA